MNLPKKLTDVELLELLPDWLVRRGIIDVHGTPYTRDEIKEMVKRGRKCPPPQDLWERAVNHPIDYFCAEDVVRAFRELTVKEKRG